MTPDEYQGPLTVTPDLLEATIELANRNFIGFPGGDMGRGFPLLYDKERLERLRILVRAGRPVSLVGLIVEDVAAMGCSTKIGCIGSVCTDEADRGRGLASRLVGEAEDRARSQAAAVMLISGGRGLYQRRGSVRAGLFHQYTLSTPQLPPDDPRLSVDYLPPAGCREALGLFESEPVHFRRTDRDYARLIVCGSAADSAARSFLVRHGRHCLAVASLQPFGPIIGEDRTIEVCELAGSRQAVLAALRRIAERHQAEAVRIHAYCCDYALQDACCALGGGTEIVPVGGLVKLLDANRLWRDFAPLLAERIGPDAAGGTTIHAEADELKIHTLTFRLGGDALTLRGPRELTAALFGAPDLDPLAGRRGRLADILRNALPLPLPLYGLNFV